MKGSSKLFFLQFRYEDTITEYGSEPERRKHMVEQPDQ